MPDKNFDEFDFVHNVCQTLINQDDIDLNEKLIDQLLELTYVSILLKHSHVNIINAKKKIRQWESDVWEKRFNDIMNMVNVNKHV